MADLAIQTNSTNSLLFRWSPPEGDLDSYELFLYRKDDSLQERRRVQPSSQQSSFQGLTPGAPYRMVVVTHSGEQSNQTSVWARTGKPQEQSSPAHHNHLVYPTKSFSQRCYYQ